MVKPPPLGLHRAFVAVMAALLFAMATLAVVIWLVGEARAQDGHSRFHMYYKHWKQPGTTVSCCDARIISESGIDLTGDCEPTRGEIRNGQWFFWLRQESRWIAIPDDRLIRERNPSSEEAHLCARHDKDAGKWIILCAVPPDTGG